MVSYRILWKRSAEKELRKIPKERIQQLWEVASMLENDPCPQGVKKMIGTESVYRLRVGDYRLVYRVDRDLSTIEIILVGHRRDVYR
ncbi:type II toxin-antitoxin system RelE family toxin [Leptospirillum ferrooxidans]|jgi:mRNA interferase RelE/StbE|uniref:Putative addiction module antitoxin n=1 Tax=Leptospirillum ferrooxidans (strain C2-3) TaxID=1162668 RepID=I0INA8_LEPFC|nr:putative addiction module antitoxin [Leptospirillum ferrooxidans C2-3]